MSKLKVDLPKILQILSTAQSLIKPITQAVVDGGGFGFRKRMRDFAEETRNSIVNLAKAQTTGNDAINEDLDELRAEIVELKKHLATPSVEENAQDVIE